MIPADSTDGGKRRDDAAFEELVKTWSRLVFSTALHRLEGDAASAREVMQNVFLTAFRKCGTLAKADSPAAWFHRAAMLESSNFLRAERCRRRYLEAFTTAESIAASGPPEPIPEPLRIHLDEALNHLRDHDRELILSRFFEGRSFQEIAERRRSTPDAVRVRLNRLLKKLAALLRRRGVAVTAVSLGAAFTTQWARAAASGTGAALAAALQAGPAAAPLLLTTVSAVRIPVLITIMTSGKTMGVLSLAVLLALLALRSQSGLVEDLRAEIDKREAEAASAGAADSRLAASTKRKPAASASGQRGQPDSEAQGEVTGSLLLAATRNANGVSSHPEEGTFENTGLDGKLKNLTAAELLKLLEEVAATPGGAGLKSRARYLLIARHLAEKDPAEALRQASRYHMPDDTFLIVARSWCKKTGGDSIRTLLEMVDQPGALPAGKFGSDPAAAIRRGIAAGVGLRDLPQAVELCRSAAGTTAAGDYLAGLTYLLGKGNRRETLFDLLKGVPEPGQKISVLAGMAVNLEICRAPYPIASWFDDPAFPPELRNQAVLKAADSMRDFRAPFLRKDDEPLRIIAEGSAPGDRLRNTLEWLRTNQPPDGEHRSYGTGRETVEKQEDDIVEAALRLAATEDSLLAARWLPSIQNPERRQTVAQSLGLDLKKP